MPPGDLNRPQRAHLIKIAEDIVTRFKTDDAALAARAEAARADGYGNGGTDGPSGSGISDPTLGAVLQREHNAADHAITAITTFGKAVDLLINADKHRADALPPGTADPETVDDLWCTSCIRIGWHSPRDTDPKHFGAANRLCNWCATWRREHKFEPPESILTKRARGERVTTTDVDKALVDNRRGRKKKR